MKELIKKILREHKFKPTNLIEKKFDFFHISTTHLGSEFVFSPQVPDMPYHDENYDTIEDDFTKRISLGTSIEGCLNAITDEDVDGYFIYGVTLKQLNQKYLLDLSTIKPPKGYGVDFVLQDWMKGHGIDYGGYGSSVSDLPDKYRKLFYGCVPDHNLTGEYWYLRDLKMKYIGEVVPWKYGTNKIIQ